MTFKAPKAAPSKEEMASYYLHKLLCQDSPGRSIATIHASDVIKSDFCPRRIAIMRDQKVKSYPERLGTCQRVVFRIGRDLEHSVRMWFANLGFLMGNWRCVACDALALFCKKPEECVVCEFTKFYYEEVRILHEVSHISGSVDMMLKLPNKQKPMLYELKSMDKDQFKGLQGPLGDHLERTQLYLDIAANDEFNKYEIDLETAGLIYVSKGGYGRQTTEPASWGLVDMNYSPFREYFVKPNPEGMKYLHARAQPATDYAQEGGELNGYPDGICGSPMEKRAQACEVMGPCFK